MTAKCKHKSVQVHYADDDSWFRSDPARRSFEVARRCARCSVGLALGPANDEPKAVHLEIRAATTLDQWLTEQRKTRRRGFCLIDDRLGWDAHASDDDPDSRGGAGWLMREMHTHDDRDQRDRDAWPWDPTQSVAEQGSGVSAQDASDRDPRAAAVP